MGDVTKFPGNHRPPAKPANANIEPGSFYACACNTTDFKFRRQAGHTEIVCSGCRSVVSIDSVFPPG